MSTPRGASAARGAGSIIQTPTTGGQQRHNNGPSSAGPVSAGGTYRTPNTATRSNAGGGGGGRRTPGTAGRTPHARAARLALDSRRTAIFTPGGRQSRRKSGRMLRDSPRDLLRNLSRRLAPISQPIASSSSPGSGGSAQQSRRSRRPLDIDMEMDILRDGMGADSSTASATRRRTYRGILGIDDDEDDDSLPLDRPRMSLNIEDNDNDDDLRPHRSLILENGGSDDAEADADADLANFTMRSIELARRAATQEQLLHARRFSRASLGVRSSFGSMRMSDYMDQFGRGADGEGDDDDIAGRLEQQSAFFPEGAFDNLLPGESPPRGSADMTFERVDSDTGEQQEARLGGDGRESGFGVIDLGLDGGNETTFMLGQQSPDRTLGPVLLEGDGENDPGLLRNNADGPGDFGATFDNVDDYGDNENNGNFWQDEDSNNEDDAEGVAVSTHDAAAKAASVIRSSQDKGAGARGKRLKLSARGIAYPSLPVGVIKRIAQTFAQSSGSSGSGKAKLSQETVAALSTASDWFFEQVGVDLQRYAKHGGRKTIDESDVLLLMRRYVSIAT